jgi:hypothetical protein
MRFRWFVALLLATAACAQNTTSTATPTVDAQQWWEHVKVLAADDMEGRETGSKGYERAADYVIKVLQANGIEPAGTDGYRQPIKFTRRTLDETNSSISLIRDGQSRKIIPGQDAVFGLRTDLASYTKAKMVFVGYGLQVPEANHDDLAGVDLRGKIAVYISGAPANAPPDLASHYQFAGHRWKALKAAGAVGTIAIANPKSMDIPWERSILDRLRPQMRLADKPLDESAGWGVSIGWNPAKAAPLFLGAGHALTEILDLADAKKPLPHFPIPGELEVRAKMDYSPVGSFNVVAKLTGSDPKLKHEYVVLTAHLDHLGISDHGTDRINNGALDNAAGVSALLEVAAYLKKSGARPKRSIMFVFVTAEEKGLLGSRYFVMKPTVPRRQIVANINSDMFLPINPPEKMTVRGMAESDLGEWTREVVVAAGSEPISDPEPQRNAFIRSDQYNFIRAGIPAVVMTIGYAKGTKEEAAFQGWLKNRYHSPSDDLDQPVNMEAAAKYMEILANLLVRTANSDKKPEWKANSFFRRFAR